MLQVRNILDNAILEMENTNSFRDKKLYAKSAEVGNMPIYDNDKKRNVKEIDFS